jgi:undecaprenyl-diphosphatase
MHARLAWVIVVATIPPGLLGLLFQKKFEAFFAAPAYAALFLAVNGFVLLLAEWLTRRRPKEGEESDERIARLPFTSAALVGVAECLALFPGFSRTGTTLSGGLLAGMNRSDAARYSFLLATPLIFAAALLKVPHLVLAGGTPLLVALSGAVSAGVFAYLSVRFLTRYFKTNSLLPFAIYCIAAGLTAFAIIG